MVSALTPGQHDSLPARQPVSTLTLAIVSQKGGVGKTTLAIHLAQAAHAAGFVTVVTDLDPQATAATWGDWRDGEAPEVITTPPVRLPRTLRDAREAGAQVMVIDTPPNADTAAREAVRAADIILIPVRARAFDLHAIATTAALVQGCAAPAWVVFNAMPARSPRLLEEASQAVARMGLSACQHVITERAAFHRAPGAGQVASEIEPTGKAAAEIAVLWDWLRLQAGMKAHQHVSMLEGDQ
jgi:chromosome partitioning protein